MGFISEFKEFINKGNIVDLAVAVILGGAFQKIVDSLVTDIIMPIIAKIANLESVDKLVYGPFTYGKFLGATINFILVALVLFMIIKMINRANNLKK